MAYGSWGRPYAVEQPFFFYFISLIPQLFPAKSFLVNSYPASITIAAIP